MTEDLPTDSVPPSRSMLRWPWGQSCGFLLGLAFFVMGMETLTTYLAVYFHLISRLPEDHTPWLQMFAGLLMLAAVGCGILAVVLRLWRFLRQLPPPTRVPWLGRSGAALFIVGLLAQTFALSLPAFIQARRAQQQATAEGPWREHVFADGVMRLSTPQNWEIVPNPDALISSIYMVDRQNDLHLIANMTPKQDLAIRTLEELSQRAAKTLAQEAIGTSLSNSQWIEIDGHPAVDLMLEGTFNDVNLVCYFRHVDYPDAWIELRLWTTRSRFPAHEVTFAKIASSVRHR